MEHKKYDQEPFGLDIVSLNHVFDLPIYYLPVEGHFVVFNSKTGHFLDWLGTVKLEENESPILFSKLKDTDPQWYTRIIRDCVR